MNIIMPTFERIEWMPPTIYLIETLADMGHNVTYITVYPDSFFEGRRSDGRIRNVSLWKKDISLQEKLPYVKGISGLLWRVDKLVKRLVCLRLKKTVDRLMTGDSLLWVVNEMTVMLGGTRFLKNRKYVFTVYELHEKKRKTHCIEKAAKNAQTVVVPEYCRAHIMQSRYCLNKTPVVLPNKTELAQTEDPVPEKAAQAISILQKREQEGYKTVLYMGGINEERPLEPVLQAIGKSQRYRLVVMGRESAYLSKLQKEYPEQFDYLGAFRPPVHIQVAEHAHIGLLMYVSINQKQGLNALFCAPNKLYEYTGKGLPVITNDIPGLRFPVELNKIGCVTDFSKPEAVLAALEKICREYGACSKNAIAFFEGMDINKIIYEILESVD
ncbi:MAG: hypothetical protein IJB17_03290 [Oscillospiraceae bacterium]|nr:hypothetical protein [Oscillospiraceae bacterium]